MRVGVTGGRGFIGGYVCDELRKQGYEPVIFDRQRKNTNEIDAVFLGDVLDETAVFEFAAHVDGIIHLAAVLGTQETIQNPIPSVMTNIIGSLNVFEAANRYNLPVVYIGVGNHFFRNKGATGSYTISKACAEDYARMFNAYRNGRINIVRPVNAYGPRQSIAEPYGSSRVRKIMPSFICRALLGEPIEIYGDGNQISDCVYVGDVAKVLVASLEFLEADEPVSTVEVGPVLSHTVNEIAQFILEYVDRPLTQIKHVPMRPGELPGAVITANTNTLSLIGIDAKDFIPLKFGIAETINYYHEHWLPGYLRNVK